MLQSTFAEAPFGIAVSDRFGRLLIANRAMHDLLGYMPGELLERDLRTIIPDISLVPEFRDASASFDSWSSPTTQTGDNTGVAQDLEAIRKDASLAAIRVAVSALSDESDCLCVVSVIDVSNQRRVESQLSRIETQARFQAIVTELATRCAAAPLDGLDEALVAALRDVGDALAANRCVAYLPEAGDEAAITPKYFWARAGGPLLSDTADTRDALAAVLSRVRAGDTFVAASLDELSDPVARAAMAALGARACVALPLGLNGARGALVIHTSAERSWPNEALNGLRLVAAVISQSLARKHDRDRLESGLDEMRRQRDETASKNAIFRRDATAPVTDRWIASQSVAIRRVLAQVQQVAPTTATVLLLGETGAGKDAFAQAIHNMSPRQGHPMVRVSCAAIPAALIESELFGRERGAFTGALSRQIGRFEAANGSTIFLDEIGDLPLEIQVKLLRVLQERTVERLGGNQSVKVDVRVIAATNRNLERAVENMTFREDLFYRLNVFPITIPPLRERLADIPSLVWTFIDEFSHAFGKKIDAISKESLDALQRYSWPGNVRELRNIIEREMIIAIGPTLTIVPPRPISSQRHASSCRLVDVEVDHIRSILDACGWRVRGTGGAAERLGVKPTTLESRMARLGIVRDNRAPHA